MAAVTLSERFQGGVIRQDRHTHRPVFLAQIPTAQQIP
jgi:hypothetical protein